MYTPPPINEILLFPTGDQNKRIKLPRQEDVQIGDILVAKYNSSRWARWLPWKNWHHAALISKINPLTIIEAKGIKEIRWLRPVFPDPLREMDSWRVPRSKRKIITENEARKRIIAYARKQLGEPYGPASSKWSESSWYCSLLIYKSYSRTITSMYLESYEDIRAGFFVTPEDLFDSKRTKEYFAWKDKSSILIEV